MQDVSSSTVPSARPGDPDRNAWWHALFEGAEDAQLVCRTDGAVVEINRRTAQLLGQQAETLLPAYLLTSLFTDTTVARLLELLRRTPLRPEQISSVSLLCRGQLGLVADLGLTPLADGYALLTLKDAGRRWRMESHVQRLITAVNAASDVVLLTDADFRVTFVNPAFQQVAGHLVEEAVGRKLHDFRNPAQAAKIEEYTSVLMRGGEWRGELENLRRDGTPYPVEAAMAPIYNRDGTWLGCVSFERDITLQKRLQRDLQLERDYTQSIINSVDAAIYTVDRELRLQHVNLNWQTMPPGSGWLQFDDAPRTGTPLLDYVPDPVRREEVRAVLARVLREGVGGEIRGSVDEGQYWLVKVTPWKHGADVLGLNYVVVDQTSFCQLQVQLFQAQKMETVGALAAGVAHDFNNLLLAIRGNLALIQLEDSLPGEIRKRLGPIEHAATRATEITQQLLSFSRSSEEKPVVLDFNQVLKEAGQLSRRTLKNRLELKVEPAPVPVKVRLDNARAHQVLLNLVVNAADSMPQGGSLTLKNRLVYLTEKQAAHTQRPAGTEFLCCSVRDTGSGIPPEVLAKIFEPFFTTKPKGKGTGLGLSIVSNVVTRAGGFIEVESEIGKGTTFHINLPLVQEGVTAAPTNTETALIQGRGRILVVEDMDFILEFTLSFLTAAGYEVLSAPGAEEALAALEREGGRVDLLLTDYNMPGRSGLELIRTTRAKWPGIRCLLATGYLEEEEHRQIVQEIGENILTKPYNVRDATAHIGRLLGKPPAA